MANLTAVTGNWTATAGTNTAFGSVATTAADEITIPNGVTVTIVASNTVLCRSLTVAAGGTLVFAATTSVVNIGDSTAGTGNVALSISATATITLTAIGVINFISTSATQQTITSGGKTLPTISINGAGSSYVLGGALTTSGTFTLAAGTFSTSASNYGMTLAAFNYGNATARTLTLGSSAITITGATGFNASSITNLAVTNNSAVITLTAASPSFVLLGTFNWNGLSFVLNGGGTIAGNGGVSATVANLTITGTASQTVNWLLYHNLTCTGTFTVTGNSAVNRVLIGSSVLGTTRTITAATVSLTNVDFMDITGAGAATWSGTIIGNRLGNSGITFTTPATQTRDSTNGAAWSVAARWTSRVPLPQDDVVLSASSGSISSTDVFCLGKTIDASAYTGTITSTSSATSYTFFGDIKLGGTFTQSNTWILEARGRGSQTITSNGKTMWGGSSNNNFDIYAPGGSYSLADAIVCQGGNTAILARLRVFAGTFDTSASNYSVTCAQLASSTTTYTRAINLRSSTVTLVYTNSSNATNLILATTNLTFTGSNATIAVTGASNIQKTIDLQGQAVGAITFNSANDNSQLYLSSAATIGTLTIGSSRALRVAAGVTITTTNFVLNGTNQGYQRFSSVAGAYASVSDSVALSWTSDFDLRARLAPDAWNLSNMHIAGKATSTTTAYSWGWSLNATSKQMTLGVSANGTAATNATSSASIGFADGSPGWLRVTWRASDGRVQFFTAADSSSMPSSWSQLGTNQTANVGSIFDSSAILVIGALNTSNSPNFTGNYYRFQARNNILDDGTGIQLDVDFTTKTVGQNTFTEGSSNAATVTINGNAVWGDGRVDIDTQTAGSAGTISSANPVDGNYLRVKDSTAAGSVPFYAGANSVNVSNNTNWTFASRVNAGAGFFQFM